VAAAALERGATQLGGGRDPARRVPIKERLLKNARAVAVR